MIMETMHTGAQSTAAVTPINPAAEVGTFTLRVADLTRSLAFYAGILGFQALEHGEHMARLGAGSRTILALLEVPGAGRQPTGTTGLYHAAILFPDRRSLAIKVAQLAARRLPFGQADHLVSEAFYLSDPDGNGLELYRDRPRTEWSWADGQVRMATDPIDFDDLFAGIKEDDPALAQIEVPEGTRLGHMHLRVADLDEAERFYHGVLRFDITARWPGALFMSAGGYHHHLGLNTWESRGGRPPAQPSPGLAEFSLVVPDQAELDRLAERVAEAGLVVEGSVGAAYIQDPFENRIKLALKP
jgi:catechol 2,3-dioxygenase